MEERRGRWAVGEKSERKKAEGGRLRGSPTNGVREAWLTLASHFLSPRFRALTSQSPLIISCQQPFSWLLDTSSI